jgi:hypothetical protein
MKYITFYREDNNFDDILNDVNLKKVFIEKYKWTKYLMVGIDDKNSQTISYITLKYGDDMKSNITRDYTPIPGVDYLPKQDKNKYQQVIE